MSWNLDEKTNLDALIQNIYIQEIIFIVLIVLCRTYALTIDQ
jgi:hypothetical protein